MAEEKVTKTGKKQQSETHRVTMRFTNDEWSEIAYWAKKEQMTINDFIKESVSLMVRHLNGDYDLPRLEIQRLNQIIAGLATLSSNTRNLERVVVSGFDSLTNLTRGDNYLYDEE